MTDFTLIPPLIVAFATSAVAIVVLRPIAKSVGLVDRPGGRKFHIGEVPVIGGMAMFSGLFAGLVLVDDSAFALLPIFVACTLLVAVGVVDDKYHIHAPIRIAAQIVAVLIMVFGAGLALPSIGDPFGTGEIGMGGFTLIFTTLVTVTMINAYNLIDGVDGLAGSMALLALLAVAVAAGGTHPATVEALTASAAVLGYLVFNFPSPWNIKVRTFMGDAGSTLLGFTIVWITLGVTQGPDRVISPVHCLWFAAIPIFDTLTCFVRRVMAKRSPFRPGRDHFHHSLKRGGFSGAQILAVLAGLQALYVAVALIAHFAGVPDVVMFSAWSVLGLSQRFVIQFIARHRRAFGLRRRRA